MELSSDIFLFKNKIFENNGNSLEETRAKQSKYIDYENRDNLFMELRKRSSIKTKYIEKMS